MKKVKRRMEEQGLGVKYITECLRLSYTNEDAKLASSLKTLKMR